MGELAADLGRWGLDERGVRERLYGAPTARVATALERDAHTVGGWLERFRQADPDAMLFEQTGGPPPPSTRSSRRR